MRMSLPHHTPMNSFVLLLIISKKGQEKLVFDGLALNKSLPELAKSNRTGTWPGKT